MSSLKDGIVSALNAVNWNSIKPSQFQDASAGAVAHGFYSYLTDTSNFTPVLTAVGTLTPPVPPIAYTNTASMSLTYIQESTIKSYLLTALTIPGVAPGPGILAMFGVFTYIAASVVTTISGWSVDGVGTLSGVGTTAFPLMSTQGALASADMLSSKPSTMPDAWTLISKYVVAGLKGGIVSIPAAAGMVSGAAFTGSAAGSVVYS